MLQSIVLDTIYSENMINPGDKIVVGLSGGADSCALLKVLCSLKDTLSIEVCAAHLNHGIRGEEAQRDMDFSKEFAQSLKVEFYSKYVDVPAYCKKMGISEETAGRNLRYEFFNEICTTKDFNKIAVAHNKNDRVETILMNLIRGCGANGLEGIKPQNNNIIRPLINVCREDIEKYTADNNIPYVTDSTNNEDVYTRNIIRNVVLKHITSINSNAINNIVRTSDIITEENKYIEDKCLNACPIHLEGETVYIVKNNFSVLSDIEKRRIFLMAIEKLCGSTDGITFSQIINALKTDATGKLINFSNKVILTYTSDKIIFSLNEESIPEYSFNININDTFKIPGTDIAFTVSLADKYIKDKNSVYINADNIDVNNLTIRTRNEGDEFAPSGLKGKKKKVKKFFIDEKIPIGDRNKYPLLVCKEEILAILPLRVNSNYTVSSDTKTIIKITRFNF